MQIIDEHVEAYRYQVRRLLTSHEFATSRQLREFLEYVSEAAFQGRTHLEQTEIAEQVLQRGKDFNPLDDASVRKLATNLRQRLEKYYDTEGVKDLVRVTLPVRSYVPVFELRSEPVQAAEQPQPEISINGGSSRRSWLWLAGGGVAALTGAGVWWRIRSQDQQEARPVFRIQTRHGDVMHERNELAPDAIQLGPQIGEIEEVTARMVFTPERATQQAGLLIYGDADRYVKLGRQFLSRPQLEFGMEVEARYRKPPNTFAYDPDGQTGEPVWLTIRRSGSEFRAFLSSDGLRWRSFGNVLRLPVSMPDARAAIFGHNGRSDAPSTEARFDRLRTGLSFHHLPEGPANLEAYPGWRASRAGESGPTPQFDGECLALDFTPSAGSYGMSFARLAPGQEWTVTTRLDFQSVHGSTAGLVARGDKGQLRLIRWDVDGGSITAEHLGNAQVNRRDFEGSPPVILRMQSHDGRLQCSFSRDDRHYETLPLTVPFRALTGKELWVGIQISKSSWMVGEPRPPARFYWIRQELDRLQNYR